MAQLAFPDAATRLAYPVTQLEVDQRQDFLQIDTGVVYLAVAQGAGAASWQIESGPQSPRASIASTASAPTINSGVAAPSGATLGNVYIQDDGAGKTTIWTKSSNGTWVDAVMNQ